MIDVKKLQIPPALMREAEQLLTRREVKTNEFFCKAGDESRTIGLVERGFLRIYYVMPDGTERTKLFRGAGEFIAPYAEIVAEEPARTYIQAVRDSVLRVGKYDDFNRLAQTDLRWAHFLKEVAEHNYLEKDQREYELLTLSPTERYQQLVNESDWIDNAPLRMIASYLSITPIALSRIRKRLKKE